MKNFTAVSFIIVLAAIAILFPLWFYFGRPQSTSSTTQIVPEPTVDTARGIELINARGEGIKTLIATRHKWSRTQFEVKILYSDDVFTLVAVTSDNSTIPEGEALIDTRNNTQRIVYDNTIEDPCASLTSGDPYPPSVVEKCNL